MSENELNRLEERLLDLEFQRLKKANQRWTRATVTRSTQSKKKAWTLSETRDTDGSMRYHLRSVDGARDLPKNRALWPADVRKAVEKFEALDQARSVNGRLISRAGGSARLE
jgi:hypothetical protein